MGIKHWIIAVMIFFCGITNMQAQKEEVVSSITTDMWALPEGCDCSDDVLPEVINNPPAPQPEPVIVKELPLPPTAPSKESGLSWLEANPSGTGCIDASDRAIEEGPSYMWDGKHVLLTINFSGAPAAPDPRSIYSGQQVIMIKTDGSRFENGDSWKCLTCGIPEGNRVGVTKTDLGKIGVVVHFDHPQPFHDGKRILAGRNIIESPIPFANKEYDPAKTKIYPIWWNTSADGSGKGGSMREIRLNPDDLHLGWSSMVLSSKKIEQFGYFGRLVFNPAPKTGDPLVPRYELENVYVLLNKSPEFQLFTINSENPNELIFNEPKGVIGEFRGFSSDGQYALGIGIEESGNFDAYKTSLATGESTKITRNPAYTDPMRTSPDDQWTIQLDSRVDDRQMWCAGMRGVPPLVDLVTVVGVAESRNNGNRRFFQPYLIDIYGDRGSYQGQQLNAGDGAPGSISDPLWNARADPQWSPDGTKVVYWQALLSSPSCGGENQAPCPESTEPGARRTRLMIAELVGRKPMPVKKVEPVSDEVPWGIPYKPGDSIPVRFGLKEGKYRLQGKVSGSAIVDLKKINDSESANSISVVYNDYTDDGLHIINGTESVHVEGSGLTRETVWHSNLASSGCQSGTKVTSSGGFKFIGLWLGIKREGKMITTINGRSYVSPENDN